MKVDKKAYVIKKDGKDVVQLRFLTGGMSIHSVECPPSPTPAASTASIHDQATTNESHVDEAMHPYDRKLLPNLQRIPPIPNTTEAAIDWLNDMFSSSDEDDDSNKKNLLRSDKGSKFVAKEESTRAKPPPAMSLHSSGRKSKVSRRAAKNASIKQQKKPAKVYERDDFSDEDDYVCHSQQPPPDL